MESKNHPQVRLSGLKLIVYDLDGTLVDAFEDIWRGINSVMRQCGLPELPFDEVKSYVGEGARMLVRRCLGERHADRFDEVQALYRAYYAQNPAQTVKFYPGVLETLPRIRELGYRQAVLTNKPEEVTRRASERLGLAPLVDGIWGEVEGVPRKPHPESLRRVLRHFGFEPAQCVLVGDGRPDYEVARAAGTRLIQVTWGQQTRPQLEALAPDAIMDAMAELVDLLGPAGP